jgi:hypothetical protein
VGVRVLTYYLLTLTRTFTKLLSSIVMFITPDIIRDKTIACRRKCAFEPDLVR